MTHFNLNLSFEKKLCSYIALPKLADQLKNKPFKGIYNYKMEDDDFDKFRLVVILLASLSSSSSS